MDASEPPRPKIQCKGCVYVIGRWKNNFPIADGTVTISEGSQDVETFTFSGQRRSIFQENRKVFNFMTRLIMIWWWSHRCFSVCFRTLLFSVITWNPESNCKCRPKNHCDNTKTIDTTVGMMLEKSVDDYWRVDGDRELVRYVDLYHKNHFIPWKVTWWIYMVQQETDEKTNDLKDR